MVIRGLFLLISFLGLSVAAYVESLGANLQVLDDRLKKQFEPQIAVKCGFLNQYMLESGHWAANKDGDATCLTRKEEILSICRKAYPDKDVTNIIESSSNVFIDNWCEDGSVGKCATPMWVKPYRCVVGSFQSDALLVPEGCNFSHTYDKRECKEFDFWNQTAQEACALKGLAARSFGMLVPCGIDLFSGVEYVCCPVEMETLMKDTSAERGIEQERSRTRLAPAKSSSASSSQVTARPTLDDSKNGDNWQDEYLRGDDENTEHEKYQTALLKLETHHQERLDKMMKEWTDVSSRYKELKKSDPQGAKKLKTDLMSRMRKTVAALEEEFEDQKRQLVELHQQRIEVQLNERKRQSMDAYLDAIQERHPKVSKLLGALEKYIKAEEKDRQHSVNRYRHVLSNDPDAADEMQPGVLAHLRDLDQRINESMKMLNRVPQSVAKEVEERAREFWEEQRETMFGAEITNDQLLRKHKQQGTAEQTRSQISRQKVLEEKLDQLEETADSDEETVQEEPENEKVIEMTTPTPTSRPVRIDNDGLAFMPLNHKSSPVADVEIFSTTPTTTTAPPSDDDTDDDTTEDETVDADDDEKTDSDTERETESVEMRKFQDVSSAAYSKMHREEQTQYSSLTRVPEDAPMVSKVLYVGFGLAGVALLAGMMLAIVLLRRRSPTKEGFAPVDTFASPEERHIANMQAHGYTNPFFNHAHQYSKA